MKKSAKSFVSFTRTERVGLVFLCSLLIVLICFRVSMPLWVHPDIDTIKEKKLVAAWETFKQTQLITNDSIEKKRTYQDAADLNETLLPDIVDLNTADSITLVRLKGIGPVTAHKMLEWRKKNGSFTDINQLKEVGHFNEKTFRTLKKHLSISQHK